MSSSDEDDNRSDDVPDSDEDIAKQDQANFDKSIIKEFG